MQSSLWQRSFEVAQLVSHIRSPTALTCRSHTAVQMMASPSCTQQGDDWRTAASSDAMQCSDSAEVASHGTAALAAHAACSAVAVQSSPPECPPCIPSREWLQPANSAASSRMQVAASASARQAEAAAHAAGCREGGADTGQRPQRDKSCATTGLTQHRDAGTGTEPRAGNVAAAAGASQPVQPPNSDADVPPGKAARHGKRDRDSRPKPPRPTHFMAIPLCQASLLQPTGLCCTVAETRCNSDMATQQSLSPNDKRRPRLAPVATSASLATYVQEPGVVAALATVQQALARHTLALQRACVATCTAHITLGVMHLPDEERLQDCYDAVAALGGAAPAGLLEPFQLSLAGLSHFNHKVLYLDVVPDGGADTLQRLARHVRDHLSAAGVDLDQGRGGFTPHVTVAKLSAMAGRGRGSLKRIPEAAYAEHVGILGGSANVSSVQLCCMAGRQRDEYYQLAVINCRQQQPICWASNAADKRAFAARQTRRLLLGGAGGNGGRSSHTKAPEAW